MIYTGEDNRKVYLKCEKCNHITNVPKSFIKENNDDFIKTSIPLICDCKNDIETDVFYKNQTIVSPEPLLCPRCQSSQIHAEKRGWKITSGFLGSSKIMITCLACGHKWQAGK